MREAQIASLEAELQLLMQAKKFKECEKLNERIGQLKNAHTDILRLKAELDGAKAARSFKACAEIQERIEGLKVRQFPSLTTGF